MITAGIHPNFSVEEYHKDPCPSPSLSQSIAKILIDKSPAHAKVAHPRLNPAYQETAEKRFDIGSVVHRLLLGRGRDIEKCLFDDWRTRAAREAREAAIGQGRLPVLAHDYERAAKMVEAAWPQIEERGYAAQWAMTVNDTEVMIAAEIGGVWCRSLVDYLQTTRLPWDYKTTSTSAAPHDVARRMATDGWHIQSAMQERILDELDPQFAGRRAHHFMIQETYEPFALSIVRLPEAAMTIGRRDVDRAIRIWGECLASGRFPAYTIETLSPEMPTWAVTKAMAREESDD